MKDSLSLCGPQQPWAVSTGIASATVTQLHHLLFSLFRWLPGHTNLITPYSGSVDRQGVHLNLDHTKALELKFFVTNCSGVHLSLNVCKLATRAFLLQREK
ncbi:hypothetical protein PSAC2689_110195 [Paraburkholderia sacchari]